MLTYATDMDMGNDVWFEPPPSLLGGHSEEIASGSTSGADDATSSAAASPQEAPFKPPPPPDKPRKAPPAVPVVNEAELPRLRDSQRGFTDADLEAALAYVGALKHPDVAEVACVAPDNFLVLCQTNPEFESLVKAHAGR